MKTLAAAFFLLLVPFTHADDMQQHLKTTQDLVRQGKYEEALERFVWFHEHALEHQPSMYGVRLSFALSYWKALGEKHPPAAAAMVRIRDADEKLLREGKGSRSLFHDLVALNRTLGDEPKSVELFEHIHQTDATKAREYWSVVKDVVLARKRYDLAKLFIRDLDAEYQQVKARYDRNAALYDDPRMGGKRFRDYSESTFVDEVRELLDLGLALENREAAEAIRAKALKVLDDERLKAELPKAGDGSEPK